MYKAIKNITSAVADLTVIVAKESAHQITSVNDCCTDATRRVAWRAEQIRRNYEQKLAIRNRKPLAIEYIPEGQDQ
jgi:hypothetical protein